MYHKLLWVWLICTRVYTMAEPKRRSLATLLLFFSVVSLVYQQHKVVPILKLKKSQLVRLVQLPALFHKLTVYLVLTQIG